MIRPDWRPLAHANLMPQLLTAPVSPTPATPASADPLERASDCLARAGRRLSRGEAQNPGEVLELLQDAANALELALAPSGRS